MFSFMTPVVSKARKEPIQVEDCLLPSDQTAQGKCAHQFGLAGERSEIVAANTSLNIERTGSSPP